MKVFSFIWSIVIKKLDFQNTSTQIQDHFLVKNVQMGVQNPYWCSVYLLYKATISHYLATTFENVVV